MVEFTFEIMDDSKINIQYQYGSAWFTFNLFLNQGVWTLHPFDGILLQNKDMCSLVIAELFKNKDYHVMLARENIPLSELRTSIDMQSPQERRRIRTERKPEPDHGPSDEMTDFIEAHSFNDVLNLELDQVQQRVAFFQEILHRMFMDGYGPEDTDFTRVQALVKVYKETLEGLRDIGDKR
ncbi:hypothetical protein ACFPYJ_29395 [Paenibacillus solisilvae]|uniref:Uncharacterized protein n=1 Tax=Paenibacillus solisilvae TaxID=2486751 RepID=A0ABW0WA23_9BACL